MKWRVFVSELDRGIFSVSFLMSMLGTVVVIFAGSVDLWFVTEEMVEQGLKWQYELEMLHHGVKSEVFVFFLPLLSVFPTGISVLTELRTGMLKSYLPRCGRKCYILSKVIVSVITGGGSLAAGYLLTALIMGALYRPMEVVAMEDAISLWPETWALCLVVFSAGACFSLIGATLGLLLNNRYMAFGGAFMVCYLMIIASSRYVTSIYVLNPREWLDLEYYWEGGYIGCAVFLGEIGVILSLLYGQLIHKRIGKGAGL